MKTRYTVAVAMLAGVGIGAVAVQGLHAQAKLKAYSVGEIEVMGAMDPGYLPTVRKAIEAGHGHAVRTLNGRVVTIEGAPPPKNVAIVEWDSLDDAVRSTSRKPGPTWRRSAKRRRRQSGGTS